MLMLQSPNKSLPLKVISLSSPNIAHINAVNQLHTALLEPIRRGLYFNPNQPTKILQKP